MTAGNLGGVKFWATNSWKIAASFDGQIASLSRTGSLVAISQSNPLYWENTGRVSLWNYRTGEKLAEFSEAARVPALSPLNDILAAAGPLSGVYIWDMRTRALIETLPTKDPVWTIAFSPDGLRLVTAGWSAEALVWDLRGVGQPVPLKGHLRTVWSAAFSPDGSSISTVSSDQTIRSWDAKSYAAMSVLRGHENEVWCLAISPDGQLLATGGKDQTVRLWSAAPRQVLDELPNASWNRPLFSADGRYLTTALNTAGEKERREVWDLSKRAPTKAIEPAPLASSSAVLAAPELNTSGPSLECPSPEGVRRVTTMLQGVSAGPEWFGCSGFSPDLAWFFGVDLGGRIRIWEVSTGRLASRVDGPKPPVRSATLSAKGLYFALSFEQENLIHLYSVQSGRDLQLKGHRDFVSGLGFSPDARMLASGSVDGTILLWDCASGAPLGSLPGHLQETTDVAFSPDGRTLASLAHKDSLKLWHLATLREMVSIDFPEAGRFLQFAPDGGSLAVTTSHNMVRLFAAPSD
jgi:WD40 repeat protein